ncbi:ABC transporter ATP-binding protein [Clostridium gasigenes]|uniref:ABC transporter ATP-binding protein n=1 Tax=Clostridium gasigenes TaxID=94869 RepID=UPI001C0B8608|nr:ABC transporter ATP-binding protein [Clostridium gasigenes]MBU3103425.1 ABC transporter ATP-binding protein/permease [Clostridium gasigenes]
MKECIKKNKLLIFITVIFSTLSSASMVFVSKIYELFFDVASSGDIQKFKIIAIYSSIYVLVISTLFYIYKITSKKLIRNVITMLRGKMFAGILARNLKDFTSLNTADYISYLTNDIKLVEDNYIRALLSIWQNIGMFIGTVLMLLYYSPLITIVIFVSSIVMFAIPTILGKVLGKKQNILSKELANFTSKIKDVFLGFDVIQSFNLVVHMNNVFNKQNKSLSSKKYDTDKLMVMNDVISQTLGIAVQIISSFLCVYLVITGELTIGMLAAILQLCVNFVNPLMGIMNNIPLINSMKPILKKLDDLSSYKNNSLIGTKKPCFEDKLTISNLEFSYDVENPIIQDININIFKNKKYAVIGKSGCGKSTLIKLLLGYYSDFAGEIKYDNESLRNIDITALNEMTSIIHQNVYMFDETIRDNICLYKDYSNEDLNNSLYYSGLDKFIESNPNGLEYLVGENGANLSGGQRQRIAIARAIIKKTPVLVLDEGTSAVDMQTAYNIESNLLKINDLTLITITHKMSEELLDLYDEIIFMENGQIVEIGNFEDLLNKKKKFYNFYTIEA